MELVNPQILPTMMPTHDDHDDGAVGHDGDDDEEMEEDEDEHGHEHAEEDEEEEGEDDDEHYHDGKEQIDAFVARPRFSKAL